jgi:nicotinate-nucleotide adenylyltransferase
MTIGLLGAAFDPPHVGHIAVTRALLEAGLVDEVRWVPVKQHPFAKNMTRAEHRLAMAELCLQDSELKGWAKGRVKIETWELTQSGPSYSLQTLQSLAVQNPGNQWQWIMGADNLANFTKWHNYQALLKEFEVWVYPRPGFKMEPLLAGMKPVTGHEQSAASSTLVRQRVASGEAIDDLVIPAVAEYIQQHHLYV